MICLGFPGSSAGKESACDAGDLGLIPGQDKTELIPTTIIGFYDIRACT